MIWVAFLSLFLIIQWKFARNSVFIDQVSSKSFETTSSFLSKRIDEPALFASRIATICDEFGKSHVFNAPSSVSCLIVKRNFTQINSKKKFDLKRHSYFPSRFNTAPFFNYYLNPLFISYAGSGQSKWRNRWRTFPRIFQIYLFISLATLDENRCKWKFSCGEIALTFSFHIFLLVLIIVSMNFCDYCSNILGSTHLLMYFEKSFLYGHCLQNTLQNVVWESLWLFLSC